MGIDFEGNEVPVERESDQDIKDRQTSELAEEKDARDKRLGIGKYTEDGPAGRPEENDSVEAGAEEKY